MFSKIGIWLLDTIQVIAVSAIIIVILHLFIVQPQVVDGLSMYPNLDDGDRLLVEKVTYRLREPKRGEVIVFNEPEKKESDFIKRLIGLPGESILIENNKIIIFNEKNPKGFEVMQDRFLSEEMKKSTSGQGNFLKEGLKVKIPTDKYVFLGDNRKKSYDSRYFGFVDKDDIVGKATYRYWPFKSFGGVDSKVF